MAIHLIVYASRSLIPPAYADQEIGDLVAKSVERNRRGGITGALLYTENERFAQALEGDATAVQAVMDSIRRDPRHTHIVMLHDGAMATRAFGGWSLAFRGHAPAIDRAIQSAEYEAPLPSTKALSELLGIMQQLVGGR